MISLKDLKNRVSKKYNSEIKKKRSLMHVHVVIGTIRYVAMYSFFNINL